MPRSRLHLIAGTALLVVTSMGIVIFAVGTTFGSGALDDIGFAVQPLLILLGVAAWHRPRLLGAIVLVTAALLGAIYGAWHPREISMPTVAIAELMMFAAGVLLLLASRRGPRPGP